jgi:hypothetical protein
MSRERSYRASPPRQRVPCMLSRRHCRRRTVMSGTPSCFTHARWRHISPRACIPPTRDQLEGRHRALKVELTGNSVRTRKARSLLKRWIAESKRSRRPTRKAAAHRRRATEPSSGSAAAGPGGLRLPSHQSRVCLVVDRIGYSEPGPLGWIPSGTILAVIARAYGERNEDGKSGQREASPAG